MSNHGGEKARRPNLAGWLLPLFLCELQPGTRSVSCGDLRPPPFIAPVDLTWMGSFGEGWFVVGARIETRRRSETEATWTPRLAGSCQAVRSVITGCLQVGVRHCWALVGPGEDAFLHLVRFQFDFPMDHSYQKHTSTA